MLTDELSRLQCAHALSGEQVLQMQVADNGLCLMQEAGGSWCLPPGWEGVLVARSAMTVTAGGFSGEQMLEACLVKLQVFIDLGIDSDGARSSTESWAVLAIPVQISSNRALLERWYIEHALRADPDYLRFAGVLRQSPNYWLVRFLLEQGTASEKLMGLARRYGVSVSHFRRLCHQALGGAAKPELRDWRTAKALLTKIRGDCSLTDVALEFGYASSSHFSKEVRELLGVAPSRLTDIMHACG